MEVGLCERFPALSPFTVRRTRASEVFLLMRRMQTYQKDKPQKGKKDVIRRPAGDDWF